MRMKLGLLVACWLATAGGAGAVGAGGLLGGSHGVDLAPVVEGCVCYGWYAAYGLVAGEAGNVNASAGHGAVLWHAVPDSAPGKAGLNRWVLVKSNVLEGRLEARTDGGASLQGPADQFASADAFVRVTPGSGVHAGLHDNAGGLVEQQLGVCADTAGDGPLGLGLGAGVVAPPLSVEVDYGCTFET